MKTDELFGSLDVALLNALHAVGTEIVHINAANGWNVIKPADWTDNPLKVPSVLALIHSEVSEALEAYRHGDRDNFREELADIFIRLVDMSHGLEIDLAAEIMAKLAKNKTRGFRHGGKVV